MKRDRPEAERGQFLLLLVAALVGFCAMSYEVLWFRILRYFVDNSIQSFAIILTAFLIGLAVGSLVVTRFVDSKQDPLTLLGIIEASTGLLCLVSTPTIARLNDVIESLNPLFGSAWTAQVFVRFLVFSLAMFLPTSLMGAAFPVITKLSARGSTCLPRAVGQAYGANTLGGLVGSLAAGFVLVPHLGVQKTLATVSVLNVLVGLSCILGAQGRSLHISPESPSALWPLFRSASGPSSLRKFLLSGALAGAALILLIAIPSRTFQNVYCARYPAPAYNFSISRRT